MTTNRLFPVALALLLCGGFSLRAADPANGKPPRDAANVMNEMRLRQLTKRLELTPEQQTKVKAMFVAEADKIAKIDESGVSLSERTAKVTALKKETQSNIRPLLTPAQIEKLDQQSKQPEKRKKKA